ncbi:hypothetical protein ABW21_db0206932 [Orbilia brochopaga]|nr:hypothetical protein ABW21_db0206932 [Drechslerella brochopaga]
MATLAPVSTSSAGDIVLKRNCPIDRIPNEVLAEIFQWLPKDYPVSGGLRAVCSANKRFHQVGTPVLYRRVMIKFDHAFGLGPNRTRALKNFPAAAGKYVKELQLVRQPPTFRELARRSSQIWIYTKQDSVNNIFRTLDKLNLFVTTALSGNTGLRRISLQVGEDKAWSPDLRILSEINVGLLSIMIRARAIPPAFIVDLVEEFFRPQLAGPRATSLVCSRGPNIPRDILEMGIHIIDTELSATSAFDIVYQNRKTLESLYLNLPRNETMLIPMLKSGLAKELFPQIFRSLEAIGDKNAPEEDLDALPLFPALKRILMARLSDDLEPHMDILQIVVPIHNLTTLRLCGCKPQGLKYATAFKALVNLKELAIVQSGNLEEISKSLKQLQQNCLEVLTLIFPPNRENDPVKYPARELILKHAKTLRVLWLECRYDHRVFCIGNLTLPKLEWPKSELNVHDLNQLDKLEELCAAIDHNGFKKLLLPNIRQLQLMDQQYYSEDVNKAQLASFLKRQRKFAGQHYKLEVVVFGDQREVQVYRMMPEAWERALGPSFWKSDREEIAIWHPHLRLWQLSYPYIW